MRGLRAFIGGVGFVVGTPRLWPLALVPVLTCLVLFVAFGALGLWAASQIPVTEGWSAVGAWLLRLLASIVALLVAGVLGVSLAQPLSGWALDRLVRAQEQALGLPQHPPQRALEQLARSLGVTMLGLAVSVPVLGGLAALSFFVPAVAVVCVPLKLGVLAMLAAWDLLDYPFSQRGLGPVARLAWIRDRFGRVLAFGLSAAVVLLIPGVGLFVLPMGVAGAARLVAEDVTPARPGSPPRR